MVSRLQVPNVKLSIDDQVAEMLALVIEEGFRTGDDPTRLARRNAILATLKWIQANQAVIRQVRYQQEEHQRTLADVDTELD